MPGLFDDVLKPQPKQSATGLFDDVLAPVEPEAPERSGQDYLFDLATRVRQGTRNVVGGLAGLPVDIANLATEAPRLAMRGGDALRSAIGLEPLNLTVPAIQQPAIVQGIRESGNIANAIDAAEHLSPMAEQQGREFAAQKGLGDSFAYLATHPSYAGTEAAAQIPQFLQLVPGSTLGTIALQGASAASQNNQQIGDTMRAEGADEQQIADRLADAYAPSLLGNTLLPSLVPGGAAIERMLAGRAGKEAVKEGGTKLGRLFADFLGETGTEGAQEALDQVVQNAATGHPLSEGVGQSAALGALIGAPGGAIAGLHEAIVTPRGAVSPELETNAAPTNAIDPSLLARANEELAAAQAEAAPAPAETLFPEADDRWKPVAEVPRETPVEAAQPPAVEPAAVVTPEPATAPVAPAETLGENNGSGDSSASIEAINRLRDERDAGQVRAVIERDGTVRPLIGVDAVDTHARTGQIVVQRGIGQDEWTVLSQGDDVSRDLAAGRLNAARGGLNELAQGQAAPAAEPDVADAPVYDLSVDEPGADEAAPAADVSPASTIPPTPAPEPRMTGVKNAVTDAEREAADRHPILAEAVKSNPESVAEAITTLKADPNAGAATVAKLTRAGVEGITTADEAVLLVHKTDLMNKRDAAAKKLADPNATEDEKRAAGAAWDAAEAEIAAIDVAAKNSGREWGRFGQLRRRMMLEDFSLAALEQRERVRLERPLTATEQATVKAMADKIAVLQKRVDELEARSANSASEAAYEQMERRAPRRRGNRLESLRRAADEARRHLRESGGVPSRMGQSGAIDATALYDLSVIGAYHVANGASTLADWVKRMVADVGQFFADLADAHGDIFAASKQRAARETADRFDRAPAEVLAGIDKANVTAKDVRALVAAHIGAGLRGEPAVIGAAAKDLGMEPAEVRDLFVQSEPRGQQTLSEAQQELSDLRKMIRLQKEIDRLEAGQPAPARVPGRQDTAQVAAKKAELAEVRRRLRPRRDPEGRYQEMRGKQIAKRIEELQARIAAGDFAPRKRVPRALNEANQKAMNELDKAKEDFLRHQFEDNLRRRTPLAKIWGVVPASFNLARAVMTSVDLSAILRQGGFIAMGHPLRALGAIGPSLKSFVSESTERNVEREIASRKNAPLYKRYGLQLTGIGTGPLKQIEEAYASRWLTKLPWWTGAGIVRGSGRAYVAFLNRLRADTFDAMVATLAKGRVPTEEEGKAIASYINVATGRGKAIGGENAAQALNTVFFAPRLVASRFQLLAGQPLYGGSNRTRSLIAQEYARFAIGVSIVMALSAFALGAGEDDEEKPIIGFDPRSSDFLKIRVGNTYIDAMAGLAQVSTFVARELTGETVSSKGKVSPLRTGYTLTDLRRAFASRFGWAKPLDTPAHKYAKDGGLPFGASSGAEVIGRFLQSKLAPVPAAIISTLTGTDYIGNPITPLDSVQTMVTPMSFQNIADIMEEHGVPKGTAIELMGILGMGIQQRGDSKAQQFAEFNTTLADAQANAKAELAKLPPEQWESALEAMKKKGGPALEGVELTYYKEDGKYGAAGEPKRDADGRPILKSNRIADQDAYRDNADAPYGDQVHHIIPDNLVRHHPLMRRARELGYDLDASENLLPMPAEAGGAIAHNTSHPQYDAEVFDALNMAERRLRREHGALKDVPKADMLDAIRKIEADMRKRIESGEVPTKKGRLAVLDRSAEAAA